MDTEKTKVAFFIEKKCRQTDYGTKIPREVTAVFVESGNYLMKECYAHEGQHSTCSVDWIPEECRTASYDEYKPLYDELQKQVGYNLEVLDAKWWIETAMAKVKAVRKWEAGGKAA